MTLTAAPHPVPAWIWLLWLSAFIPAGLRAQEHHWQQNLHFRQISTAEGLSDNYIQTMEVDRNGYLWIGTGEGLNRFDGTHVEKYFKSDYPALQRDEINQILCDDQNRLWIRVARGHVTLIDQQRRFHRIGLYDQGKFLPARRILYTKDHGVILLTRLGHFVLREPAPLSNEDSLTIEHFDYLPFRLSETFLNATYDHIEPAHPDEVIFATDRALVSVQYDKKQMGPAIPCASCKPVGTWNETEILISEKNTNRLFALNMTTGKRHPALEGVLDQYGRPLLDFVTTTLWIHPDRMVIATRSEGLYIYDRRTHSLRQSRHNASDPSTLVNNAPNCLAQDNTGWVFVGATPNGISYFNQHATIGQQLFFQDQTGQAYDGHISHIYSRDMDTYYLSVPRYLIEWKRSTNESSFLSFPLPGYPSRQPVDAVVMSIGDRFGHLWVGTFWGGLYVLDENLHVLHHFAPDTSMPGTFLSGPVTFLVEGPDDRIWVGSRKGLARINPRTFKIDDLSKTALKPILNTSVHRIAFLEPGEIWISTARLGVQRYRQAPDSLQEYRYQNGLLADDVLCASRDRKGNYYFGTVYGLSILLTNGSYLYYTEKNGLLNKRVEALLLDRQDRMWMGNDVGLACFNMADTSLRVFDERYGLSIQGFRINSYHQNQDDELFWGTERGLQYFYPDDLYHQQISLKTTINRIETRDLESFLTESRTFTLAPGNTFITFYFSTIDFSEHLHTFYQYQLTGIDPDWINITDQNSARYNSLKSGTYTFRVRASNDRKSWVDAENEIHIHLRPPWFESPWFKLAISLALLSLLGLTLSRIRKKQRQRTEALETESVVNYFASQINMHKHVEDMLWDVSKNCISKLHLEECVIYLLDPDRHVLVQKAAYGPKNPEAQTIHQPIEIPLGQGITGHAAQSMKPVIVNNTERDPRYIVDDERRLSEMAVPILVNGQAIGVIDSEHSQRNFFTNKHLSLMTTISILTANQIQRIQAEEAKQKAEIEILKNKQKATESRLQSLRLQMNPHFLFNALNSIQQMILANEEMVATRYLSRFSKLLRSILIHSDKEMISLREELEILQLYVELESVRFKDAFRYEITCDPGIDDDEVKIPTLLIQPFVENAIWHGLMHKEGMRQLRISFMEEGDFIHCSVEDNGIGRQKARELKISTGQDKKHKSKGIEVSLERLKAMQKNGGEPGSMTIHDLADEQGNPMGTRIDIYLPILN